MTYLLSQIENSKQSGAGLTNTNHQIAAVVDAVMEGWSLDDVEATAAEGVADADLEIIGEIIEEHELSVTAEQCSEALLAECIERINGGTK